MDYENKYRELVNDYIQLEKQNRVLTEALITHKSKIHRLRDEIMYIPQDSEGHVAVEKQTFLSWSKELIDLSTDVLKK